MADETPGENRQFDTVLSRLDALMKRNQASRSESRLQESADDFSGPATMFMPEPELTVNTVPVLTDVFQGGALQVIEVSDQPTPPVLTQTLPVETVSQDGEFQSLDGSGSSGALALVPVDMDATIDELMPLFREMVVRVAQEELSLAQQTLQARVLFEAEQLLRRRLMK